MNQNLSRAICIAGMMRSGTSMTARILELMGVYFGNPKDLKGYNPNEPTEHLFFRKINGAILRQLGCSYDKPPVSILSSGWERDECLKDLRNEAYEYIENSFSGKEVWGWKTPTSSLLIPFWNSIIPEVSYIICIRNPIDVAISCKKFRNFPISKSLKLWLIYTALAVENTRNKRHLLVFYEDLVGECRFSDLVLIAKFAGLDLSSRTLEKVKDSIRQDRWHHRSETEDVLNSQALPELAKDMYLLLEKIHLLQKQEKMNITSNSEDRLTEAERSLHELIQIVKVDYIKYARKMHSLDTVTQSIQKLFKPIVPSGMKKKMSWLRDKVLWS
jgi:hypothetical protein